MTTPIYNFVQNYIKSSTARLHMPGHKGRGALGAEAFDITEIKGADELYSPCGIIAESEDNATALFGTAHTFYSTEGSTLAIKAMLAVITAGKRDAVILAARNAHKALIYAAALLDFSIEWLYSERDDHLCSCVITPSALDAAISAMAAPPAAVYITSPDYLGRIADIKGLSEVCKRHSVPLLVDNAHGAYLAFREPTEHPIHLGATMCADSAHKTLPVLTGGAYLHVAKGAEELLGYCRSALSLFASTSPSYLILESLDLANRYLSDGYRERLAEAVIRVRLVKERLCALGLPPEPSEEMKIVINAAAAGYSGHELAEHLRAHGAECEFSDGELTVLMITPENTEAELEIIPTAIAALERRAPIHREAPPIPRSPRAMSIRDAVLSLSESIPTELAEGRVLAAPTVSCPPAIPIAVSGELISRDTVDALIRYGIGSVRVIAI